MTLSCSWHRSWVVTISPWIFANEWMSTYSNSTHFSRPSLNDTTSKKISLIPSSGTNFHLQASSTVITSFVIPLYTHSFSADDLCLFIFENMGNRERNLESQENHQLIWCLPLLCCFSFYKWQMTFSYQSSLSPFVFWNPLALFFFTSSLCCNINLFIFMGSFSSALKHVLYFSS